MKGGKRVYILRYSRILTEMRVRMRFSNPLPISYPAFSKNAVISCCSAIDSFTEAIRLAFDLVMSALSQSGNCRSLFRRFCADGGLNL